MGYGVGGGGVGVDSVVRVGGSTGGPPVPGSASSAPAAMAIGATGSAAGATGSAAGATGSAAGANRSAIEGWRAIEPPATEPPATDPPASDPPGGCRLASDGADLAAFSSRICAGSQLLRSAAAGYAADRSVRNWVAVGLRLGSRDRLRLISGLRLSGTWSVFGLPCTTR